MLYDYKWEEDINLSRLGPNCRSKQCNRAHFKYGEPKRKMIGLVRTPTTTSKFTLSFLWFCMGCKTIRFPR